MRATVRITLASIAAAGWVALVAPPAFAQQDAGAQTVGVPLDPKVRTAVDEAVARARLQGLPTEPLVDKAFEGTAKHADPSRIITAVRTLMSGLSAARHELGASTGAPDLVAGAEVLRAGVDPGVLAQLRRARPNQSLLVPLVVLADLVARGVPSSTAADAVLVLAKRGAPDADFNAMQQDVQHDIQAGAAPADAAAIRSGGNVAGAQSASAGGAAAPGGKGSGPAGGKPPTAGPKSPAGGSAGNPQGPPGKPPKDKPAKDKPPTDRPPKSKPPKGNNPHSG